MRTASLHCPHNCASSGACRRQRIAQTTVRREFSESSVDRPYKKQRASGGTRRLLADRAFALFGSRKRRFSIRKPRHVHACKRRLRVVTDNRIPRLTARDPSLSLPHGCLHLTPTNRSAASCEATPPNASTICSPPRTNEADVCLSGARSVGEFMWRLHRCQAQLCVSHDLFFKTCVECDGQFP